MKSNNIQFWLNIFTFDIDIKIFVDSVLFTLQMRKVVLRNT